MANFFALPSVAARYAAARPDFYPLITDKIGGGLGVAQPFRRALDVACGTGLSTRPLRTLAQQVVGADISAGMLAQAMEQPRPGVHYLQAPAEQLPFRAHSFDLITISLAFHWLEQERFLGEVRRLLRPGGWLVIYNNWFTGRMVEDEGLARWSQEVYLARYPSPPRQRRPLSDEDAGRFGLRFVEREAYENEVLFERDQLVAYLCTQSNVVAAVEYGQETLGTVYGWLQEELGCFFVPAGQAQRLVFAGYVWCLQGLDVGRKRE